MVVSAPTLIQKEICWRPALIKRLRGKRTQAEFGGLLGVPKNTVWRWEAGRVAPNAEHSLRLSQLAEHEGFLTGWKLVGSVVWIGNIEEGSRHIAGQVQRSLARTTRQVLEG